MARFNGTGVVDQGIALPAVLRCKLGKSYDHRTHWSGPDPPAVAADPDHRQVVVPNWQIPLRVGQRTALVQGDIVWVPGPSPWLWRLLAAAAFALMVLVGWRSWYSLLAVLVVIAVTADAFHTIGALMGSPAPLPTKLSASLISVVAWAAALAALWQLRRRRLQAGRILLLVAGTLLAFASAVSDARTLASSQLVTTLDPALTRTGIALTLSLGLGMVAASLVNRRTARPTTTPRQAVGEPGAWPTG